MSEDIVAKLKAAKSMHDSYFVHPDLDKPVFIPKGSTEADVWRLVKAALKNENRT